MGSTNNLINSSAYRKISSEIETFVAEKLAGYSARDVEGKTIHDSVWGSVEFSEWEMQIVDSPLFQRLRDINQVGLAMLTYPAARHSRFEHSLGVTAAAKKMCEKISTNSKNITVTPSQKNCIFLAALMHDIGHCFYSHLSETIYGEMVDFVNLRAEFNKVLHRKPKAHEMLSFIIVNTKSFKDFFVAEINYPDKASVKNTLFADVGQMIIGSNIERDNIINSFQTAIINGPFDADKLDYIKRDSLTAGLALEYDIERLFTKILVHPVSSSGRKIENRLVIKFNGVTAIEELTFCKIMLFSYIYYHQKVLISETMIKDYVHGLCKLGIIGSYADFLRYTDSQILSLASQQGSKNPYPEFGSTLNLERLARNIKDRILPKRCFEASQANIVPIDITISESAIKDYCKDILAKAQSSSKYSADDFEKDAVGLSTLIMRSNAPISDKLFADLRELTHEDALIKRNEFYLALVKVYNDRHLPVDFTVFDIYLVFPKLVNYGSSRDEVVLGKDNTELMTINDFVKLDDWAGSFNSNKWRGYVFVSQKIDRAIAFEVAENLILKGQAKLKNPTAYLKGIE